MLLFFCLMLLIFTILLVTMLLELKLTITDFEFSRGESKSDETYRLSGSIGFYFLRKIKLFSIKINNKATNKMLNNKFIKNRIKNIKITDNYTKKTQIKTVYNLLKMLNRLVKIDVFQLKIWIDTESVILTSYLIGIISTIIPNLIRNNIKSINKYKKENNYMFQILPLYKNQNYIYLRFKSIISIKVVHIIYMLIAMGGRKNERSSNRWLNANCYGKH
ncbi:MAG: hypothetical protein IJ890_04475 [Clostridia bacterium]|nr:hypothetical protein [Clostridia bacterium]